MNIFLTGATGFIGHQLAKRISEISNIELNIAVRRSNYLLKNSKVHQILTLDSKTDWSKALKGVDIVIHSAARAHVFHSKIDHCLAEFRRINLDGTINLAKQAVQAGVKRFIFISSIKVNGEATELGRPYNAEDPPTPNDPYAISKYEAEQELLYLASKFEMDVVIIRPVLVYGPGVKANFFVMMKWLAKNIPLPLGGINNIKSFISIDNLIDFLIHCLDKSEAANQVFLVSDGEDVSTPELLERTALAMGKKLILFPVPNYFLELSGTLLGKQEIIKKLCNSLHVDIKKTKQILNWRPPLTLGQGLEKAVKGIIL